MLHVVPRFRYFRECQRGRGPGPHLPPTAPRRATTFLPRFKNPLRRSVLFAVSLCSAGAAVRAPPSRHYTCRTTDPHGRGRGGRPRCEERWKLGGGRECFCDGTKTLIVDVDFGWERGNER